MALLLRALVINVRLQSDRWHGSGDWPPSPFRLFQALIAGSYSGRWRTEGDRLANDRAFRWLEVQEPPLIVHPRLLSKSEFTAPDVTFYVLQNFIAPKDDPLHRPKSKAEKTSFVRAIEFDPHFTYVWTFEGDCGQAEFIASLCDRLYTFGKAVDAASATGEVVDDFDFDSNIDLNRRFISRPISPGVVAGAGDSLPCPMGGSLESLHARFDITTNPYLPGKDATVIHKPDRDAVSTRVVYERPTRRILFDIRHPETSAFFPIAQSRITKVTKAVRNLASANLRQDRNEDAALMLNIVVLGQGSKSADATRRVRFVPLPSIGSTFADQKIRRILVELPSECPISEADMSWALEGRHFSLDDSPLDKARDPILSKAKDHAMLRHFGVEKGLVSRNWRTVTPGAIGNHDTTSFVRRSGSERYAYEAGVAIEVRQAIRHAGITIRVNNVRVQAEPWSERGCKTSEYDADRFGTRALYHISIEFADPIAGPIIIGNGRMLGLGVMRPNDEHMAGEDILEEPTDDEDGTEGTIDDEAAA